MAEAESLETAAEHERILREIESTDTACIGPTLRYPGYRGHRWAGTGGIRGQASSGLCAGPATLRASAGPSLRRARRATSILGEAGPPPQSRRGVPSRPSAPAAPLLCRLLPPLGLGQPSFSLRG